MDLAKQVDDLLKATAPTRTSPVQSDRIAAASRLFDDLAARGLVESPSYKLAPFNSVPPKAMAIPRGRA